MKKVIFKEINRCDECPYFYYDTRDPNYDDECWYVCRKTDNDLINEYKLQKEKELGPYGWPIPNWCPLEDLGVYEIAIKSVKTVEFIERAKEVHGDKYNYSLVEYLSSKEKVRIICSEHGEFLQTPLNHIYRRRGCQKCAGTTKLTKKEQ